MSCVIIGFVMGEVFLETRNFSLEKITQDDFEELKLILQDLEVMYAWEYSFSDEEVQSWIDKFVASYKKYQLGYFLVRAKENKNVIGQVGLMPTKLNNNVEYEIGYILKKKFWHKGYARECVSILLDYAFNNLKLEKVIFEIRPNNLPSIRVAESFGAVKIDSLYKNVKGKAMLHSIYALYNSN